MSMPSIASIPGMDGKWGVDSGSGTSIPVGAITADDGVTLVTADDGSTIVTEP
jgi:hypothetical protein